MSRNVFFLAAVFICTNNALADNLPVPIGANLFGQSNSTTTSTVVKHALVPASAPVVAPVMAKPVASAALAPAVSTIKVPAVIPSSDPLDWQSTTADAKPKHKRHKKVETKRALHDDGDVFYDFSENKKVVENKPKPAPLAVPLPGVGTLQGDRLLNKSAVIRVNGDGTEIVEISDQFQNRISTPFDFPKVIDSSHADFKIDGSSVYVAVSGKPVVIYLTGSNHGDPVISLTLVPKPIPAQTVVLQLDQPILHDSLPKKKLKPDSYETNLASLLESVAQGATPEGFTDAKITNVVARKGVMEIIPSSRYSNAYMDIFSYKVINSGKETVQLSETSFYTKGVMAVGMYPASTLKQNEETYVYVISNKSALGDSDAR